jgi:hypothetical protein
LKKIKELIRIRNQAHNLTYTAKRAVMKVEVVRWEMKRDQVIS